jgi:hypothetical protein
MVAPPVHWLGHALFRTVLSVARALIHSRGRTKIRSAAWTISDAEGGEPRRSVAARLWESSMGERDPGRLFERWYATPLAELEKVPNGDGAFVAFSVALALYERFALSAIGAAGQKADPAAMYTRLAVDFNVMEEEAAEFWEIMRHGVQHQAMPMQRQKNKRLTPWLFNASFKQPIEFGTRAGGRVLQVQPWLFRDKVVDLYRQNTKMIDHNQSFPWASIFPLPATP